MGAAVVAAVAIVAAAPRDIRRGDAAAKVEAKLPEQECRQIAADFLGVRPEELQSEEGGVLERLRTTSPPFWRFTIPYGDAEGAADWEREMGRVRIRVNAWDGQVMNVGYSARESQMGSRQVAEGEARGAAEAFLKAHWRPWPEARLVRAHREERKGTPFPPKWFLRWVAEENGIRVGGADVQVNATTGEIVEYHQSYHPADGLPPARLTREDAVRECERALAGLPAPQRAKARVTDCYLGTMWRSGKTVLVWELLCFLPARTSVGYSDHMGRKRLLLLDAHTGEVYRPLLPRQDTTR